MPSFHKTSQLFGNAEGAELAEKFESYKGALNKSFEDAATGRTQIVPTDGGVKLAKADSAAEQLTSALALPAINKALGADQMASIRQALTTVPDVNKAISLTSPIGTQPATAAITGLTPFDLEAPAKLLVPVETPLRNKLPRKSGQGNARQYKRITGYSNAQTPTSGFAFPGITDSVATQFNTGSQPSFARGQQISYAGDWFSVAYQQFSLSDSVYWSAQYAGQGFEDIRQLSQTSVLYASMLAEERMTVSGRGPTAGGYAGQIGTMPTVTGSTATTGGSLAAGTYQVWVAPVAGFGAGTGIAADASITTTGSTSTVTATWDVVAEATSYNVYMTAAAATGAANAHFVGNTNAATFTFGGPVPSTGATAPTTDTSVGLSNGTQVGYDGIIPITMNADISGYTNNLGDATWSTASPGVELEDAFAAMYANNLANPDEVLMNGVDRKNLSGLLVTTGGTTGLRINYNGDGASGHQLGQVVTGVQNTITGKMVDLTVHPYFPQGTASIMTYELPFPNSEVDSCWAYVNVQDYMGVSWPVLQFSYDFSSYWFGTFLCYAPAWQGSITGISSATPTA